MHGLTLQVRANRATSLAEQPASPSLTPAVCGEEGRFDTALRAVTHTAGHNSVATFDGSRESVLAPEETRNPNIHFVDSRDFRRGRMSTLECRENNDVLWLASVIMAEIAKAIRHLEKVTREPPTLHQRFC